MGLGRILGGAAVVAVAAMGLSAPAEASTVSLTDPVHDNGDDYDPRGDIVSSSVSYDGTTITGTVVTAAFDNPATSPNWIDEITGITMIFDVWPTRDIDGVSLAMFNDGSKVVVETVNDTDPACTASASWNAAARSYGISFPASCVGNPVSAEMSAYMVYSTPTGFSEDDTDYTTNLYAHADAPAGYWMVSANGTVYAFGGATNYGGVTPSPGASIVDIAPLPDGRGYWLLDSAGVVTARGDAEWMGNANARYWVAGERATAISAHPSGGGYFVFTDRGRVQGAGFAPYHGDMASQRLNGPVLDAIVTPSGDGYYMVGSDGGIFSFGDAQFYGSMGAARLNAPVQSLVPDPDGAGYWLVASDGGVFAFQAGFRGSMGGTKLNKPVEGMVPNGNGYLMVGSDGGIFNFSDRPFFGSLGANPPASPVVSVALAG
jgi:hypothetical protein